MARIIQFIVRCFFYVREENEIVMIGYRYRTDIFLPARENKLICIGLSFRVGDGASAFPPRVSGTVDLKIASEEVGSAIHEELMASTAKT